ncbi:MAG: hypothetical protein P8L42_04090 [Flavicella sp.]|nr:hypothetical protein [Flavicella sp.]
MSYKKTAIILPDGVEYDAICLLQVTSPMRTLASLNSALEKFIQNDVDSLVSVREVPDEYNPHWSFTCNENQHLQIATGEKEIIARRQDLPKAYHRDGSIYILPKRLLFWITILCMVKQLPI